MAQSSTLETQTELKCTADKFFQTYAKKGYLWPQICPGVINKVEIIQGDWGTVGSIKNWHYVAAGAPEVGKGSIEAIDEQNKSITLNIFDGELTKQYPVFKLTITATEKGEGCLVNCRIEYKKQTEDIPPPNKYLDVTAVTCNHIGAYLAKA